MDSQYALLRNMSHQNHVAAIKIQKVQRAHRKRLELWKYGGLLMVSRVKRIQRCYRGLLGRRRAAEVYREKVLRCAHKIQGLYYQWHSRRLRLRAHLNFLNRGVVLLQSYFRMRAAIRFSNVIRLALHNNKAGKIQRQVRRLLGLRKVQERRRRYKFIYDRLLGHIKRAINSFSTSNTEEITEITDTDFLLLTNRDDPADELPPYPEEKDVVAPTPMQAQVMAFDYALCNLLALGRYEDVRHIASRMALAAHVPQSSEAYPIDTSSKSLEGRNSSPVEVGRIMLGDCVENLSQLALTGAYLSLSACWSRAGKMRFTRPDYMEEALGLMMQHSAVALYKAQCEVQRVGKAYIAGTLSIDEPLQVFEKKASRMHDPTVQRAKSMHADGDHPMWHYPLQQLQQGPDEPMPDWLLALEEDTVDLYYLAILSMHGVTSPYDAMVLLADWVWYQACVQEHNAAAEDMVCMEAWRMRCALRGQSGVNTARSALTNDTFAEDGNSLEKNRDDGKQDTKSAAAVVGKAGGLSMASLVVNRMKETDVIDVPSEESVEEVYDPAEEEHLRRMQMGAFRRNFAVRRVFGLLQRARRLLSAESRDRKEISDRMEIFHDLHMTEHRVVLVDVRASEISYRAHYYTAQEAVDRQRAAANAAANAKVMAALAGPGAAPVAAWMADATSTGTLPVDLQIVLCGKTVLIKGSVLLHRLVEAADDLPAGCTLRDTVASGPEGKATGKAGNSSKSGKGSKSAKHGEQAASVLVPAPPVLVAIRPFVLMRAEVAQLIDQINEELGILDIVGGGGGQDDGSEGGSVASLGTSQTGSQTAGSQTAGSQTTMSQSQSQTAGDGPPHHHHHHAHRHGHGHSPGDLARLAEYLQQHVRLVSCKDAYGDPALLDVVAEMRACARERIPREKYSFRNIDSECAQDKDASHIPPGVPSVRFSLPVVEYKRRIFNESQTVVHATHLLQRAFRGYRGRAKFRRMRWKRNEYEAHQRGTREIRAAHDAVRFWRGERLTVIQRLFRGYRWRKRLHAMKVASLMVQCAFRIFRACKRANAERRRRAEGAPVVSMLGNGRGVQIGEFKFTLKVFRSGTNYRLEGVDLMRGMVYEGAVYTPEVLKLIQQHNATITGTTLLANSQRIMPWQHERVTELLIENLGMMRKTQSVTTQLGARTASQPVQYILVANKTASTTAPPVQPAPTPQQLHGSISEPILALATAHTQKQRLQRYAQFRLDQRSRRKVAPQPTGK